MVFNSRRSTALKEGDKKRHKKYLKKFCLSEKPGRQPLFRFSLINYDTYTAPRRYPYFDVVVGLVWSHDPKSYAGGSLYYW
jgi:hypothetical protein